MWRVGQGQSRSGSAQEGHQVQGLCCERGLSGQPRPTPLLLSSTHSLPAGDFPGGTSVPPAFWEMAFPLWGRLTPSTSGNPGNKGLDGSRVGDGTPSPSCPHFPKGPGFPMSHIPCHWVPSPTPTPDSSLSQQLLSGPHWKGGRESGGTSLEHEASMSLAVAQPFPGQQECPWAVALHRLRVRVHRSHADCLYSLHRPLVTSSHRGPRTSLAWRACAAGHRRGRGYTPHAQLGAQAQHTTNRATQGPSPPPNTPTSRSPSPPDAALNWQPWLSQVVAGVLGASRSQLAAP